MTDINQVFNMLAQLWMNLESGWQAVLLGLLAVLIISAGIPIPW